MALATLAVTPDGKLAIAAESAPESQGPAPLKIWDLATGKERLTLKGQQSRILGLSLTPDGLGLVAVGGISKSFGEVNYWDLLTGKLVASQRTPIQWMETLAISGDGRRVASASVAGLRMWNLNTTREERSWLAHTGGVRCGLFTPAGETLITGGSDQTIGLWQTSTGVQLGQLKGHTAGITALGLFPDGRTLASGSEDGVIRLWDVEAKKEKAMLQTSARVNALAISPDGQTLASGGSELFLWDPQTAQKRNRMDNLAGTVLALAYSPEGNLLACSVAGKERGAVQIIETKTRAIRATLPVAQARSVSFSPDGKLLAVGESSMPERLEQGQSRVRLWDTTTWKERPELEGHRQGILDVAFSPDGQAMASASLDETIKLWLVPGTAGRGPAPGATSALITSRERIDPAEARTNPGVDLSPTGQTEEAAVQAPFGLRFLVAGALLLAISALTILAWLRLVRRSGAGDLQPSAGAEEAITVACPGCGKKLRGKAMLLGKQIKCPLCGKKLTVGAKEE